MKKKLMLVAVLLGGLTLGACVDDNESASVTAIRDAKAEQLKAAAALDRAKAEAETIAANAEAALMAAQAEYQKALAAANQALAEDRKFQLQQAQEAYARQLEFLELQAQINLQNLKNQLAQQGLDNWSQVSYRYYNELQHLQNLQYQLIDQKAQLAKLEAGLVSAQKYDAYNQQNLDRLIAEAQAKLEVLKGDAYAGLDNSELRAKAEAKDKEVELAKKAFAKDPTCAALLAASTTAWEAYEAVNELWNALYDVNEWIKSESNRNISSNVISLSDNKVGEYDICKYTNVAYYYSTDGWASNSVCTAYLNETVKLEADRYFAALPAAVNADLNLGNAKDDKTKTTLYGLLAKANADLEAANKLPETTDAEKQAKKDAIAAAEVDVAQAKDALHNALNAYNEAVETQKTYNEIIAAISVDDYNTAVNTLLEAAEAFEVAEEAWNDAKVEAVDGLRAESDALWFMVWYSSSEINDQIASLEKDIAGYEKQKVESAYDADNASALLEQAKVNIEILENKIEAQKKTVELAKAALDAANGGAATEE